jgi:uncharacterized protein YndB with AHSA1/START domain
MAVASEHEIEERVLVLSRTFDAPRALVFKLWTQPEHLARWWGPRGHIVVSWMADVRPGGKFRFHVRSPENTDHYASGVYREVKAPERLVFSTAWEHPDGTPKHETEVTLTFAETDGKTKLTLRQATFESVNARNLHSEGWSSTLDVLAEYLVTL